MEKVLRLYKYIDGINDKPFPNDDNPVVICDFQCNYQRMGDAPLISCTVMHPLCLDRLWTDNVYAEFNGERFFLKQIPTSSFSNEDARYKHDVELVGERAILNNVYVYDVVTKDAEYDKPTSNNSKFSFFGTIHEFAERLNHSLSYSGLDYQIIVDENVSSEGKMVAFEDQFFSNALQEIYNTYGMPYYFSGRKIHVGFTDNVITETFKYGANESLLSIQKQNANFKIVNRVTGVGSADNIPYYYPNNDEKGEVSIQVNGLNDIAYIANHVRFRNVKISDIFVYHELGEGDAYVGWVKNYKQEVNLENYGIGFNGIPMNGDMMTFTRLSYIQPQESLMPSIYRETLGEERFYNAQNNTYLKPNSEEYYEFSNPYIEGKPKEHIVNFEDIKPTIKGVVNSSGLRIDMFSEFAYNRNDHDDTENVDGEERYVHSYFFGKLRKFDGEFGFNLFDHAIDEGEMTISMTSGSCGACNFVIGVNDNQKNEVQVDDNGNLLRDENGNVKFGTPQDKQNDTLNNEVWVALKKDIDTFNIIMPNATNNYKPSIDDTFVILHIDLPTAYILNAEKRLEKELIKYMSLNNDEKFTFSISFSRIFFAEHPEILAKLNENSRIQIEYNESLYELYVSSFSYSMSNDSPLPTIKVDLADTLTIKQNALQNAIDNIKSDLANSASSADLLKQGLRYFLRKDVSDRSRGTISSDKGFEAGKFIEGVDGVAIYKNATGQWCIETDNVNVRRKFSAKEVEIQTTTHIGGQMLLSAASMVIENIEENNDSYRCFFRKKDGEGNVIYNQWKEGDLAYCNTFNLEKQSDGTVGNHFYWREVVGISSDSYSDEWHYVDISKTLCALDSSEPKVGDKVVHLGYSKDDDKERQNAIVIAGAGSGSPYIRLFVGIKPFELPEPEQLKPGDNRLSGRLSIKAGSTGWQNIEGLNDSIQQTKSELEQALEAETEAAKKLAIEEANAYADGIVTKEEEERIRQAEENLVKAKEYAEQLKVELDDKMNNLEYGKNNLLLNSGFTGDFVTASLRGGYILEGDAHMFSPSLKYWDYKSARAVDSLASESTMAAVISDGGFISQTLTSRIIPEEHYVFSFQGKGGNLIFTLGEVTKIFEMSDVWDDYVFKFHALGEGNVFRLEAEGECMICELQLERGTLKSAWGMSPLDNRSELAKYETLTYLKDLLRPGVQTTIDGGTINTGLITMGKVSDEGDLSEITAGVSGQYMDDDSVAFWAGGKWEDAIFAVNTYLDNPNYTPTEDELRKMAHYVVTHGGRAILNDVILRGYIYALGGKFKGEVEATSGKFNGMITAQSMNLSVTDGGGEENPTDLTTSSGFRLEGYYKLPLLTNNTFTELVGLWISPVTRVPRLCTILCNDALIEVLYYNGTIYNGVSQINISHEGGYIKASMMGHQYSEWGGQCWNLNIEKSSDVYVEIISHA